MKNKRTHRNNSRNLSETDRIKGGLESNRVQKRDSEGRYDGKKMRHKVKDMLTN